jgi:myo-inositol-1(or 4)-monophosphatase
MNPMLNIAIKAASRAAQIIVRGFDRLDAVTIDLKSAKDFVSEIDQQSEREIINVLRSTYPDHTILGEESGHHKGNEECVWIIDPLDGTNNFIHGFPHFAISIAFQFRGVLQHGLIYDPIRQETFTASRGEGARLNNRRMRVSQQKFDNALLGTGFPVRCPELIEASMKTFNTLLPQVLNIRAAGSAALDLAYVAAGRMDGFWECGLKSWDLAAGALMIKEAGGTVTDFRGGENYLDTGAIVVANSLVHKPLLKIVEEFNP